MPAGYPPAARERGTRRRRSAERGVPGIAGAHAATLIARREPVLALRGRAVGPRRAIAAAGELLLDAVVADGRRGVEPVGDVGPRQVLQEARVGGVAGPHPG